MSSSLLITLEMAGVLGIVLILGGWELWSLRRDKARDRHSGQSVKQSPEESEKIDQQKP